MPHVKLDVSMGKEMGKVSEVLRQLIEKQLRDHRIVVWYDPESFYTNFIDSLPLANLQIVKLDESIFSVRAQVDDVLEFVSKDGKLLPQLKNTKRLLVYAQKARKDLRFGLIELESCGVVMEPGAAVAQRNTRLRSIAERIFKTISPAKAADILKEIEAHRLTLEELDALADNTGELKLIRRVFPDDTISSIVPQFLSSEQYDNAIAQKDVLPELASLLQSELGISIDSALPVQAFRESLYRTLLLTELAIELESAGDETSVLNINIPDMEVYRTRIKAICGSLRNNVAYCESYIGCADAVENSVGASLSKLIPQAVINIHTLPLIDVVLLNWIESETLSGDFCNTRKVIEHRKSSFWSRHNPTIQMRWTILDLASQVLQSAARVSSDLKRVKKEPDQLIKAYVSGYTTTAGEEALAWCVLDRYQRHLEAKFAVFELEIHGKHSVLEKVVKLARRQYIETVGRCADVLCDSLAISQFNISDIVSQDTIFATEVLPKTLDGKTAYILVDALRFEMAGELIEGLSKEFESILRPAVAQLPTFTEVGMAALMPGAESGMELIEAGPGKVAIKVGGAILKDRASRIKHFETRFSGKMTVLKLSGLMKPSKKLQQDIADAELIVVTSQEIDRRGEEVDDEEEARVFMNEVLEKLRRGIRRLRELGVHKFVISADHGYLFIEDLDDAMRINAPGGQTIDLHPRVWIGRGGRSDPGYLRVPASEVGLSGTLELSFPRGIACFRARGASRGYFHGGLSFQELVIPLLTLEPKQVAPSHDARQWEVKLEMSKPMITTRFFSVESMYVIHGIFPEHTKRVKLVLRSGRLDLGTAAMSAYGFEEGTHEIVLENNRPNAITVMLSDEMIAELKKQKDAADDSTPLTVSVKLLDAASQVELASISNIPVKLSI